MIENENAIKLHYFLRISRNSFLTKILGFFVIMALICAIIKVVFGIGTVEILNIKRDN